MIPYVPFDLIPEPDTTANSAQGYDASSKDDQPSHPVVFTKRATSIVASGSEILPLDHFTQTLDYEGEIGVIIGKSGFRIREEDGSDYVWGYTIINDVTARERQRDHKVLAMSNLSRV
jgi:2-keto-4-pentenoate hydratase/2-oxohepta-3-ene-1,7-dioic acid hydratase in catechol pathway